MVLQNIGRDRCTIFGTPKYRDFNEYKKELLALQEQIDTTDREIDRMVYELYGLTEDEVRIVEGE